MPHNRQELLDALKFEVRFLETGGYEPSVHSPRSEMTILRDSPSCLNFASVGREHPCAACWLIDLVPAGKYGEDIPCHHIPLNEAGDTIADDPASLRTRESLRRYLHATIDRLEAEEADAVPARP